jgi:hypothetical protein
MNYSDWKTWRDEPITHMFFEACEERVEDAKEVLANTAGLDSTQDSFYRGFIRAYMEMQDFRIDEETV